MPANKQTANYIWNSFRNSGKRHLVITGTRGSGKTTLLNALFPEKLPGLTTWAEPRKAVYLRENATGQTMQVGAFDASLPGPGNQMVLLQDGFVMLGVPAIHRCMELDSQWISIDEIGYLEAQSEIYHDALRQLLEKKQVAAVVRKQDLPFLLELCNRDDVFVIDLDNPFGRIGCVIMASGLGKRFGCNKLMADFGGKPMILQALQASEALKEHRVVVTRHPDVAKLCQELGVNVILHDLPHRSDTVRLGLEALGNMDACLFLPGDQPLLRHETVEALADQWRSNRNAIVRPFHDGTPGSPVLFPQWAFPELLNLSEGKGGGWVIQQHPECVKGLAVDDPYQLMDADTPETLELLLNVLHNLHRSAVPSEAGSSNT